MQGLCNQMLYYANYCGVFRYVSIRNASEDCVTFVCVCVWICVERNVAEAESRNMLRDDDGAVFVVTGT